MSKCPNCNSDKWVNVDYLRNKDTDSKGNKINMSMCDECGFITYPDKIKNKEEMLEYYRKSYRPAPSVHNSFTGQRKNNYHYHFLQDVFKKWKDTNFDKPVICDIGAAYGMSLNLFKQLFPNADINGTELTETMKRVAYHEFGFKLTDDIDESKKYDMIMTYKVLEHQIDPIHELKSYAKLLKHDGFLYISVPTWFNTLANPGLDGFDLDYYYDTNHINVWSREMFKSILVRSGFEILKEDFLMYGDTYLCRVNHAMTSDVYYKENKESLLKSAEKMKKAYELFLDYKYDEAVSVYPEYPQAWQAKLEMNRKVLAEKGFDFFKQNFIDQMLASCFRSAEAYICATDFCLRARNFNLALTYAQHSLDMKPNNPVTLGQLINLYKEMGARAKEEKDKIEAFKKARETAIVLHNVSSQNRDDAINQIYLTSSFLPIEN